MIDLLPVYSLSDLKRNGIYQIDGALYQYLYPDPYARTDYPKFIFRCLQGQRKKADVTLNRNTIRKAYLCVGYQASANAEVTNQSIQLSLF